MVSSIVKDADGLIDEEIDDVSYEKHRRLLQTITSKTKRKYLTNSYFIFLYIFIHYCRKVSGQGSIYFILKDNILVLRNTNNGYVDP